MVYDWISPKAYSFFSKQLPGYPLKIGFELQTNLCNVYTSKQDVSVVQYYLYIQRNPTFDRKL